MARRYRWTPVMDIRVGDKVLNHLGVNNITRVVIGPVHVQLYNEGGICADHFEFHEVKALRENPNA